jgi:hypothetical protein
MDFPFVVDNKKEVSESLGQPLSPSFAKMADKEDYFFLCLLRRKRFLRLCVAILCFFLFLPFGIMING